MPSLGRRNLFRFSLLAYQIHRKYSPIRTSLPDKRKQALRQPSPCNFRKRQLLLACFVPTEAPISPIRHEYTDTSPPTKTFLIAHSLLHTSVSAYLENSFDAPNNNQQRNALLGQHGGDDGQGSSDRDSDPVDFLAAEHGSEVSSEELGGDVAVEEGAEDVTLDL